MFAIEITRVPSSRFGSDEPETLREPVLFGGFRTYTGRRARSLYGAAPEVTYASARRRPATWQTKQGAYDNLDRLTRRGYTAFVKEIA